LPKNLTEAPRVESKDGPFTGMEDIPMSDKETEGQSPTESKTSHEGQLIS
jgi:hypothetical protein